MASTKLLAFDISKVFAEAIAECSGCTILAISKRGAAQPGWLRTSGVRFLWGEGWQELQPTKLRPRTLAPLCAFSEPSGEGVHDTFARQVMRNRQHARGVGG